MTRRQKVKRTAIAVSMLAAAWLLSGCGDDRTCLHGHVENTIIPVTVVGANGQVSTTVVPSTRFVCDEYAPDRGE